MRILSWFCILSLSFCANLPDDGGPGTCANVQAIHTEAACGAKWPSTIPGMPLAQAPSTTPSYPATISPPYDGDPLSATQLRVDDLTPLQNGIEASRMLLYGGGLKRRSVITSNTVMTISPLGAVLANLATQWIVIEHKTPSTIDPAALSGGLGPNTRYWVYAKISAGPTLSFIVTVDVPDAGLNYKSGDESALWVSTFLTDGSSNILLQTQSELQFFYTEVGSTGLALAGGSALAATAVPFGATVPSIAKSISIRASYSSTVATFVQVLTNSTSSAILSNETTNTGSGTDAHFTTTASAGQVKYRVGDAAASISFHTTGFSL